MFTELEAFFRVNLRQLETTVISESGALFSTVLPVTLNTSWTCKLGVLIPISCFSLCSIVCSVLGGSEVRVLDCSLLMGAPASLWALRNLVIAGFKPVGR